IKVARVPVCMLVPRSAFAEIDLAGDASLDHPLESAVDGSAANAGMRTPDEIVQIVRAQVPLLAQEYIQDAIAFAGPLAARRAQAGRIGEWAVHCHSACTPARGPSRSRRTDRSRRLTSRSGS